MLRRAKRLQSIFDEFCIKYGHSHLKLDQEQWRQIDYLLCITQPFFQFTNALSKTKDVTIHFVFGIYNKLFDHLEKSINRLNRKKVSWKKVMLSALYAAKAKLSQYYSKTDDMPGDLLAIATILAPQHKLQFFTGNDWEPEWADRYRQSFMDYFEPYKQRLSKNQVSSDSQESIVQGLEFDLEQMIVPHHGSSQLNQHDEPTRYLDSGIYDHFPCLISSINSLNRYCERYINSVLLERSST
jgi:hypothetical protein